MAQQIKHLTIIEVDSRDNHINCVIQRSLSLRHRVAKNKIKVPSKRLG